MRPIRTKICAKTCLLLKIHIHLGMQLRDDHLIDNILRLNCAQTNLDGGFDIRHFAGEERQPFAVQTIGQADFQQGHLRAFDTRIRRSDGRRNGGGFDHAQRGA